MTAITSHARTGYRFYLPTWQATVTTAAFVAGLSYLLGDLLNRRVDTEPSLLFLASRQATGILFATIAAGAITATLNVRHLRTGASEHEADSPEGQHRLTWIKYLIYTAPLVAGWVGYLVLTAIQRALSVSDAHHAAMVWVATTTTIAAAAALGLLVGQTMKSYAAPIVTSVVMYGLVILVGGNGDDAWWGWLVPYIDDAFRGGMRLPWVVGYMIWYVALTALFVHLTAAVASRDSQGIRWRLLLVDVAVLATGAGLLYLNGASAAVGT